jgi:sugar lactone lactonase YvrE
MLVVAGGDAQLLRLEPDGSLAVHADLAAPGVERWNEVAVTPDGGAFVNGGEFVVRVDPDGKVRLVADGMAFPNGMVIGAGGDLLVVAESHAARLTAFDVATNGDLGGRRAWAEIPGAAPDGLCIGPGDSIWYADVPNRCCRQVVEGGEVLQTVEVDRGCFSCALGGPRDETLFIAATEWRGFDEMFTPPATGQLLAVDVT